MSFLDKIVATIAPPESDEDRRKAREKAQTFARDHGWLALALQHHERIEQAFEQGRSSPDAAGRKMAMKELAIVLNGHSLAEETVLYPAMFEHSGKIHTALVYEEQQVTKVQMAKLEKLDPMSQEWLDKWEHIRGAVLHHIYSEEKSWFIELAEKSTPGESTVLTQRFTEEFDRYAEGAEVAEPISQPE